MKTITIKYTVQDKTQYLQLVSKAVEAVNNGIDFFTNAVAHEVFITYPADRYYEMSGYFEGVLDGDDWEGEEKTHPLDLVAELEESACKWHDYYEKSKKESSARFYYLMKAEKRENRIKEQIQAIVLMMNSMFPKED